jgi:isochorismate synthase
VSGQAKRPTLDLENLPAGFILSPFTFDYQGTDERPYFIHADIHYCDRSGEFTFSRKFLKSQQAEDDFFHKLQSYLSDEEDGPADQSTFFYAEPAQDSREMSPEDFKALVESAKAAIAEGAFKKVVPSRCRFIPLPDDFQLSEAFQQLCAAYPDAFVSVVSVPGLGTWLGASPEILVSTYTRHKQSMFRTVALAGTQPLSAEGTLEAAWRSKEIEEQAMVSRYIINCFKKIRLREFEEDGPRTVAAGNLMHLRTDFVVNMDAVRFPELGSVMLRLLHPTSAVCGLPKEPSLRFLQQHEAYDRSLYAGFLGPVNVDQEINIFVNLRCMQLRQNGALLYAGAGVTADSDPEKEWQETEMKMKTLENIILRTHS